MEFYFIRHGQSVNNANWNNPAYQESPDPTLTEIGREQAQILANYLGKHQQITAGAEWNIQNRYGFGLTHVYSSLMERAAFTAAPIAQALDLPLVAWKEIHEEGGIYSRGDKNNVLGMPGRPRSFFLENFRTITLPDDLDETGWWNRPYEAEDERQPRADQVFAELLTRHRDRDGQPEHRVALVSHGGFFMRLLSAILKLPWRQGALGLKSWFLLNNCSISRFDIRGNEINVVYINRVEHLPDPLIT